MARPNLSYLKNSVLFVVGLPCGALTGLTGMGASVVAQPLLRYLLGLKAARLRAAVLLVTFAAALGALVSYAQRGQVHWLFALVVLAGQTVGALFGAQTASRVPGLLRQRWLWAVLVAGLGIVLCRVGMRMGVETHFLARFALSGPATYGAALAASVLAGILSAWAGVGGALIVPVLLLTAGLDARSAQGTAIAALLLASLPGALLQGVKRDGEPQAGLWTGWGAVLGGLIGAYYGVSALFSEAQLVFVYGVALTLLAVSLLWRKDATEPPVGA